MGAADGYAVKVPHFLPDKIGLHITHHPQSEFRAEDTGVLGLVFREDIRLHRASYLGEGLASDLFIDFGGQYFIAAKTEQGQAKTSVPRRQFVFVDRSVAGGVFT